MGGPHTFISILGSKVVAFFRKFSLFNKNQIRKIEPTHIFYKELPIDKNIIFTANISEKDEVQDILFRKSNEYAVTRLAINQNIDNLIEATNRNRKRILKVLIENLLKGEIEEEHAYSLKIYQSEGYEKLFL